MRSLRSSTPVLLLLFVPALGACGDSEDPGLLPEDETSEATTATTDATDTGSSPVPPTAEVSSDVPAGLPAACDVLTPEDVAAAYGVPFGPAEPGGGGHTEGDVEWQSDNCDWEAQDLVEVQLALTGPEDFTGDDTFTCPEPTAIAATVEPVPGLGDAAFWEVDEAPPLEATLRVCTADYNFDIDLDFEDGVDFQGDPRAQSIALAAVVIAKLG